MRTSVRAERRETDNHTVIARRGCRPVAGINPVPVRQSLGVGRRIATLKTSQIRMNKGLIGDAGSCETWKKNERKSKEFS
jgi:hypothetical protein